MGVWIPVVRNPTAKPQISPPTGRRPIREFYLPGFSFEGIFVIVVTTFLHISLRPSPRSRRDESFGIENR